MDTLRRIFQYRGSQILLFLFIGMTVLTIVLKIIGLHNTFWNYSISLLLGILPGIGAIIAIYRVKQWGGHKSIIGKCVLLIAIGLMDWSLGSFVWAYYNFFLSIEIPYPSWADVFYTQIFIFWGIGLITLSNVTSVKMDVENSREKLYLLCIPILMAIVTYFFLFVDIHDGNLQYDNWAKVFVDLYYPLGDVIMLTIIILSSGSVFNFLGNRLRIPIMILISGFIMNYVADFYLAYSTEVGIYDAGGFSDYLFTISMFLLSLGLCVLHPKLLEDKE